MEYYSENDLMSLSSDSTISVGEYVSGDDGWEINSETGVEKCISDDYNEFLQDHKWLKNKKQTYGRYLTTLPSRERRKKLLDAIKKKDYSATKDVFQNLDTHNEEKSL